MQGVSIPFLVVLGFSPVLWTVIVAMAIRNSLMNAGNPIASAFAMEQLRPAERATYAAAASLLWSLGWAIAGPWYSILQATLGFDAGYAVNFVTVIVLYSLGTWLYWRWFHEVETRPRAARNPWPPDRDQPSTRRDETMDPGSSRGPSFQPDDREASGHRPGAPLRSDGAYSAAGQAKALQTSCALSGDTVSNGSTTHRGGATCSARIRCAHSMACLPPVG